jgi:hypothetical protein
MIADTRPVGLNCVPVIVMRFPAELSVALKIDTAEAAQTQPSESATTNSSLSVTFNLAGIGHLLCDQS